MWQGIAHACWRWQASRALRGSSRVHGAQIVRADEVIAAAPMATAPVQADASVTDRAGAVCVVMVADCLPCCWCDTQAAVARPCGLARLAAGIVEQTARVSRPRGRCDDALHLPRAGDRPAGVEVGADVRDAFLDTARSRSMMKPGLRSSRSMARPASFSPISMRSRACVSRVRRCARERRDSLHGHRTGALLFVPARSRDGPHGSSDLAGRLTECDARGFWCAAKSGYLDISAAMPLHAR